MVSRAGKVSRDHIDIEYHRLSGKASQIRFKDDEGNNEFVHTLNGTAVTPRHLIALIENHQQADGSVRIPAALVPYTGFEVLDAR